MTDTVLLNNLARAIYDAEAKPSAKDFSRLTAEQKDSYRERARRTLEPAVAAEDATLARQSLPVECEVALPLGSVTEALSALQEVPIDARLALRTSGLPRGGFSSDDAALLNPRIVIRWTEAR